MILKVATTSDVEQIVAIHVDAFKNFFMTSLGKDFLLFYYSCFIKNNDGYVVCAWSDEKIVGFAALALNSKGFNANLIIKNIFPFMILSIKMLLTRPKSLLRLVKNLTKKSRTVSDLEDYAELYSIGVLKLAQGKGVGKLLLSHSEDYVKSKGGKKISLTTDYYNNESTVSFYKTLNYKVMYDFITYPNRRMYRFIKEL